jgi:hypothetical protein
MFGRGKKKVAAHGLRRDPLHLRVRTLEQGGARRRRCEAMKVEPLTVTLGEGPVPYFGWSRPSEEPASRDGADPLGFRAAANRTARRIGPGLTQVTSRVRGFGLLVAGLDLASGTGDPDETFQRFERLWVLATEDAALRGLAVDHFAGSRRALRQIHAGASLDLTRPLLDQQLSVGIWGSYRRAAAYFGLVDATGRSATRPSTHQLTTAGKVLRDATWSAVRPGQPQLRKWLADGTVDRDKLAEWLRPGTGCTQREAEALTSAVKTVDSRSGSPLGRLRRQFEQAGKLTLSGLQLTGLTESQSEAVRTARAVERLMGALEEPFRAWVAGGSKPSTGELREVAGHRDWQVVLAANETDLEHLHRLLVDTPRIEAVLEHHKWMCEQRGSSPWVRPDRTKQHLELPDFGLAGPRSLFSEGLLG